MKETLTPLSPCWNCGIKNDAATDLEEDKTPEPGDVSICIGCSAPAIFTETLGTREPNDAELDMILQDEGALLHIVAVAMLRGRTLTMELLSAIIGQDDPEHQDGVRTI